MRVALLQVSSPLDEPVEDRIARVGSMLRALKEVDLAVLPELWAPAYFAFDRYSELAESRQGKLVGQLGAWASEMGIHLHAGSVLERDADGMLHNTALLFGPDGTLLLDYRKVHVFGYKSLESKLLSPGDRADVAKTALGCIGTTTCYDLRFPELYRMLGDQSAQLVIVPAAWPIARLEHWKLFTRARAVENQVFLLACNAAGTQGDVVLGGHSVVVDPWGRVLAEASTDEQVIYADIDLRDVDAVRLEFPVLDDRKLRVTAEFG